MELELNGWEVPNELQINTLSHNTANTNADRPNPACHHCKKPGPYQSQCRLLKRQKEHSEVTQNNPGKKKWRQQLYLKQKHKQEQQQIQKQ